VKIKLYIVDNAQRRQEAMMWESITWCDMARNRFLMNWNLN